MYCLVNNVDAKAELLIHILEISGTITVCYLQLNPFISLLTR